MTFHATVETRVRIVMSQVSVRCSLPRAALYNTRLLTGLCRVLCPLVSAFGSVVGHSSLFCHVPY